MKLKLNHILIIIILLLIGVGFFGYNYFQSKIESVQVDLKEERIKNDTLQILVDGQARKLVADTLTIRELNRKVDSLQIAYDGKPINVTEVIVQPRDTIKEIDTVYIGEDEIRIVDFYPSKDDFFVQYSNTINTLTGEGNSNWKFSEISLDLLITENEDGTYEANMKAPSFVNINSLDVQALPMETQERDNFGILLGGGYGTDFATGTNYLEVGGGVRINKFYIEIEGNTNKQADIGFKFEF